ncbi:hypothetical protein COCOR_04722 [Corallococcus coralloides DSM 2259]|uniref:Uncharacterized protein n=1 Tax=Corallococcus coralloides (strain ATCC 25202 / DSM 2259 / NBRC 100086 / M2) TaxID=1144275 RepID=H8MJJ2_CORCM|nr:DUF6348 family protein [Corallococcus coralloides]AFE05988.1 hypothetical protein COCOR_04722 [Corallococcus coralloides DSM 2259]
MTSTPANEQLAELLRAHDLALQEEGEWLRVSPRGPRFQATFTDTRTEPGSCTRRLDVWLEPWTGRWVVESVVGVGTTEAEALNDALMHFARASLHVLLAAFVRPPDEHVTVETWQVGGIDRKVILGNIITRGDNPGPKLEEPWFKAFESALRSLPLASGTHCVRVYYAQRDEKRMALEVLLDNQPWQALADLLETASWPAAPGFLSRRLFLVLQGGFDVSRAVAAWFDVPEDGDRVAVFQEQGANLLEAEKLNAYLPLAFGVPLARRFGVAPPISVWFRTLASQAQRTLLLNEDRLWVEALQLAEQAFQGHTGLSEEQLTTLAHSGAMVRAIHQSLKEGARPENLILSTPQIGLSGEAMLQWSTYTPLVPPPAPKPAPPAPATTAPPEAPRRPWWKFW